MNIAKLYEMQKTLDARIIEEKNLRGQDLLPNTILALQVELGEMANEWRGFKHWSDKREPKHGYEAKIKCTSCGGRGHWYTGNKVDCNKCETTGEITNPFLEEYVDCVHFFLSVARQLGLDETDLTIIDDYLEGSTTNVLTRLIYHTGGIGMEYSPYSAITSYRMAFNMFFALGQQRFNFTLEQIEAAYLDKNKVNHERQANGY
ncbi:dUTP diphosphatase [Paenibacillus xylanexedens]|uniref:dUTP diphosphatase n=1 Tax=Paenibacillus xylanexedens TaxID=528191 RepID=UPI001F1DC4B0|nr:dUTP diphosphatase [Paenibacillus xylanexedens]MCF7753417.1 dUTP diphosphatase [Paenibacillus xylanexedens]